MRYRRGIVEVDSSDISDGRITAGKQLWLRVIKHFAAAIVTPSEDVATPVRAVTGGVGAPVVIAEPDPTLPLPKSISRRRFISQKPKGPGLLVLASAVTGMGGIARYEWFWATAALDLGHKARITALWRRGAVHGKRVTPRLAALYVLKAFTSALVNRPRAIVVSHVRLSPVAHMINRVLRIPYAVALHGDDSWRELDGRTQDALRAATLLIPVSHFTRDVVAKNVGLSKDRFYVMGSILSPDIQRDAKGEPARSFANSAGGERRLLTVARLDANAPYKRHDLVIEAVAKLVADYPGLEYDVVGDGQYKAELEQIAEDLGAADHVNFLGKISEDELAARYRNSYVFVMPSRVSLDPAEGEGFGLVYLEAGIFGVPSVAADAGGSAETVLDGVTGLLVEADSLNSLVDGLARILKDARLRDALGEKAKDRAIEFSYPPFRRRCNAVLECLLNGTDPASVEPQWSRTEL